MAALFVLELVRRVVAAPPPIVAVLAIGLLLAQPFLTLRLAAQLGPVPRWLLWAAGLAYVVTTVPFIVSTQLSAGQPAGTQQTSLTLVLAAIGVFVATELVAAGYLLRHARRRTGSARIRLALAAIATVAFATSIFAAGAGAATSQAAEATAVVARAVALLAAVGYLLAFLPPGVLRRIWQAQAAYRFSEAMLALPADLPSEALWARLADTSRGLTGSDAALILRDEMDQSRTPVAVMAASGLATANFPTFERSDLVSLLAAAGNGFERLVENAGPIRAAMARSSGGRFFEAISLPGDGHHTVLILVDRFRSLFSSDDRDVLIALAGQTALLAQRREMFGEQESLSQRLSNTVEALRAASQAKSDFLASMSHELRTPLSAIIGFSDLMRSEPHTGENVNVPFEWVEHIHTSGNHLLALINDVLDLTKIEAGRMELQRQPFDIQGAISESIAGLRPLADRKSLRLTAETAPAIVVADRGRLRQVLYNLLSNAIKYTSDGGEIRVVSERTPSQLTISVIDSGVGIDASEHKDVFEEFRQVGDPEQRQSGTGLGLALTKRLVEAHGGRVELHSELGRGSTFTVVFPQDPVPETEPSLAPAELAVIPKVPAAPVPGIETVPANGHQAPKDVLIIEDDPSAVRLLRTYLETDGYHVRVARDGEQGLAQAHDRLPSAIILDVLLPGVDGWEVLRQLKSDQRLRDVPVVIVTVVDEVDIGLALGAVDYFVKPIKREALLERLARYTFTTKVKERTVRVLSVDDEQSALDLVDAALRQEGFEVVSTQDGRDAIEVARNDSIDLVICDLLMPKMDGFSVVAELKDDARTRNIPILILTAHELTAADKQRLNGKILGVVQKGSAAELGLRDWLGQVAAKVTVPSPAAPRM